MRSYFTYSLLLGSYFLACLLRSASGVIFPAVAAEISMSPTVVGLIAGMFFYGYTIAQPYCGKLCDSKSPVLTVSVGLILFSLGLMLFSFTDKPYMLGISRFLAGMGAAPTFCALLAYQANAFSSHIFARLTGMTFVFGHFGGVVGITPIGTAIDMFGYRKIHFSLALISIFIALMLLIMMKGGNFRKTDTSAGEESSLLTGFRTLLRSRRLSSLLLVWSMSMILQLTLIGLWGVIWLTNTHTDISVSQARICMTLGGIGVMTGAFFAGIYGNRLVSVPKIPQKLCILLVLSLVSLTVGIDQSFRWQLISLSSFFLGVMIGSTNVISNVILFREIGSDLIGTVTGANNVVIFISVLLSQWFSGLFIDYFGKFSFSDGISPYSAFFSILIIAGAAIAVYLGRVSFSDELS